MVTTLSKRISAFWRGEWATLWQWSAAAIVSVPEQSNGSKQLVNDIKNIETALLDEDVRDAMRIVDGKTGLAPGLASS